MMVAQFEAKTKNGVNVEINVEIRASLDTHRNPLLTYRFAFLMKFEAKKFRPSRRVAQG